MAGSDGGDRSSLGIVGFGAFGRLMAQHLRPYFRLLAYDPLCPDHGTDPKTGAAFADVASVAGCEIVVLAMPVERIGPAIAAIRPHLRTGALVLDVCSVKVRPAEIMRRELPDHVDIVGTHPLFGPQSGRDGIAGLKIAVCPIRGERAGRVAAFLRGLLRLKVYATTPEDHDREAATVQGLTHLIAKVLVKMEPLPTRMTTASFEALMRGVDMVRYDAPEVFLAIERDNPYSSEVRRRFFRLAAELDATLSKHAA
jgi:prephenate dehydrogenase